MSNIETPFPGGTYRITREENLALCDAIGAEPDPSGRAHPIFYYIATQVGMGLTVAELCERCDFDVADGPMITHSDAEFEGELCVEKDYAISGEIVSLVRKPSRTFGAVDLLTYQLRMSLEEPGYCVVATNRWILPRREEAI